MRVYLFKDEETGVFYLIVAEDEVQAGERLNAWKNGRFICCGWSLPITESASGPIALLQVDGFALLLNRMIGLDTTAIELADC